MEKYALSVLLCQRKHLKKFFNIMRISTLFLFVCVFASYASNVSSQTAKVNITNTRMTVEAFIKQVEQETGYMFVYNKGEIDANRTVSLKKGENAVLDCLNEIFGESGISYVFENDYIILTKRAKDGISVNTIVQQSGKVIQGTITDETGLAVIGANVVVKGTTIGSVTDVDGRFSLEVPSDDAVLVVSYIGYAEQLIPVKKQKNWVIVLKEDSQSLDEVIVVGYGVQKKVTMSGSVSSVKSEDITKSSTSNISDALVGRMPGLIALNKSGKPGEGSELFIRGMGTWNNSKPLMIVDGIERDFTTMDPNEIETITVLKDAAAAAVYGSRAANGVVLVTTKRGTEGKPTIALNTYYGIKDFTRFPELASPYEWAETRNKAYEMDGVSPNDPRIIGQDELNRLKSGEQGCDWFKETFKKSASQYYANLNVSGGSERVKYFVSFGHHKEDGMIDNYTFKKYNLRSNVDVKVTERLSLSADVDADMQKYDTPGFSAEDVFGLVPRQNPSRNAYHPNGLPFDGGGGEHLLEMIHNSGKEDYDQNHFRTTFKADYKIPGIDGLVAKGTFSYGKNYLFQKKFFIPYAMYQLNEKGEVTKKKVVGEKTKLDEKFDQGHGYTYNVSLNYNKTFGKHDVSALFLYEEEVLDKNWLSAYRTNFVSNSIPQLSAGGDLDKSNEGSASEWARNGLVGRFNYAYNETYMFEASFRYDGSITFPKGHRYGFFPSVSAAWRLSNETFIKDNFSFVDNLKLRASYGTLGNDRVDQWQYLSEFVYSDPATIGGNNVNSIAVYKDLVPNPDITWEKSSTLNVGLEGAFWQGLLGFEFDYFYKRTSDILAPQIRTIPETFGAALPDVNYGILDNNGVELSVNHLNKIGDFTYRLGANFSFVRNKVIQFDESETTPEYYKVVGKSFTHIKENERRPYAGLVGMQALGFFQSEEEIAEWPKQFNGGQKPGDVKYADVNKDGVINENDLTIVNPYGSLPEIIYGFNLGVSWKGFELSAMFQGAAHKSIMLDSYGTTMFVEGTSNFFRYLYNDSWTPENRNAQYPRAYVGGNTNNNRASNIWVKNGNYLRLKNIELSYSLPKSLLANVKVINGVRFYINGTNLLTFDSLDIMDPESPSGSARYYPQMKSVNFGVNLIY